MGLSKFSDPESPVAKNILARKTHKKMVLAEKKTIGLTKVSIVI
jgi:hypothetical protein